MKRETAAQRIEWYKRDAEIDAKRLREAQEKLAETEKKLKEAEKLANQHAYNVVQLTQRISVLEGMLRVALGAIQDKGLTATKIEEALKSDGTGLWLAS